MSALWPFPYRFGVRKLTLSLPLRPRQRRPCNRADNDPQPEVIAQLAQEVYANDILQLLVLHIWRFEFEVRRDSSAIVRLGKRSRELTAFAGGLPRRQGKTSRRSSTTC